MRSVSALFKWAVFLLVLAAIGIIAGPGVWHSGYVANQAGTIFLGRFLLFGGCGLGLLGGFLIWLDERRQPEF
jgi:hypothetical protein